MDTFGNRLFTGWRNGYGFGKSSRDYLQDPSVVRVGRCSPKEDRYYASSLTHKNTWEKGPMFSLGVGERPDYSKLSPSGQYFASPVAYNPNISASRNNLDVYSESEVNSIINDISGNLNNTISSNYNTTLSIINDISGNLNNTINSNYNTTLSIINDISGN